MPSKSTKSIAGRVDNNTYFNLMQMAKDSRMTLSQFIGYTLTNLAKHEKQIGAIPEEKVTYTGAKRFLDTMLEETNTPPERQQIPKHIFNPNPLNDYGRVGVDMPPDITGYYTEEQVFRLQLVNEKGVRGKWHNNLAIPKSQLISADNFSPRNIMDTQLLEAYNTGNSFYPILYRVIANSYSLFDENRNQIITFNGYDSIRYGTMIDGDYIGYNKWFYSYEDFKGITKNVLIKVY
jgi:hypothetical protein